MKMTRVNYVIFFFFVISISTVSMLKMKLRFGQQDQEDDSSINEKPLIYNTVIHPKETEIRQERLIKDPAFSDYVTPVFISTHQSPVVHNVPMIRQNIAEKKNQEKKIHEDKKNALFINRQRLMKDSQQLTQRIANEMTHLRHAKSNAQGLNGVLHKYALKIQKDKHAKLRLADKEKLKRKLKEVFHKDIQGIRTRKDDFISALDVKDLSRMARKLKKQLK